MYTAPLAANAIGVLSIDAWVFPDELIGFVARFRRLTSLTITTSDLFDVHSILAAIQPDFLNRLLVSCPNHREGLDYAITPNDVARFAELRALEFYISAVDTDLIASLSKLTKLAEIAFFHPEHPDPAKIRILLSPTTRPPALKFLEFGPEWHFQFNGYDLSSSEYDPGKHGVALPIWIDGWTIDLVRETLMLRKQEGIELSGREGCERAISMTEEYWSTKGGLVVSGEEVDVGE